MVFPLEGTQLLVYVVDVCNQWAFPAGKISRGTLTTGIITVLSVNINLHHARIQTILNCARGADHIT